MGNLVGVACGVACLMVLDARISEKGVLVPVKRSLTEPISNELKESMENRDGEEDLGVRKSK